MIPLMYANSASVVEPETGPVTMEFTILLTSAATQDVTVEYATSDDSALAGKDYDPASGSLTIPAGQMSGTIAVMVHPDTDATPVQVELGRWFKVFYLSLFDAVGAKLVSFKLSGSIIEQNAPE